MTFNSTTTYRLLSDTLRKYRLYPGDNLIYVRPEKTEISILRHLHDGRIQVGKATFQLNRTLKKATPWLDQDLSHLSHQEIGKFFFHHYQYNQKVLNHLHADEEDQEITTHVFLYEEEKDDEALAVWCEDYLIPKTTLKNRLETFGLHVWQPKPDQRLAPETSSSKARILSSS